MRRLLNKFIPASYKKIIWKFFSRRMGLTWKLNSGYTIDISSYSDWCVYNDLFVNGEYDIAIEETLSDNLNKTQINIVDLGANVGFFTLRFLDLLYHHSAFHGNAQFWLVEASNDLVLLLNNKFHSLNSDHLKFNIINGLVGNKTGAANLHLNKDSLKNSVFNDLKHRKNYIEYLNLESFFSEVAHIDLLKCDVEGSEFDFLNSYEQFFKKISHLAIEFHAEHGSVSASVQKLEKIGFKKTRCLHDGGSQQTYYFSR